MLTDDDLPDTGLSHGKNLIQTVSIRLPANQRKFVETNENQSIITKKSKSVFWGKSHHKLLLLQQDSSRYQGLISPG